MTTMQSTDEQAGGARPGGAVEIRSIDYVPASERHGKAWHLGPVWFQGNAQLATVVIGGIGELSGLNFLWSCVAIILGALIGTLFMAFHSAQGPKLGLPQMIQSRAQFGYYGSLLPVMVAILLFVGYNVFNTILGGEVVQGLFPSWGSFVSDLPIVLGAIALTIVGYRYIHTGLRWATWLFILIYGVFTIGALFTVSLPHGSFGSGGFHIGPFLVEFGAVVSYQLTWAPYVSEYSRYLPESTSTKSVFWWTYGGSALGAGVMLLGALLLAPNPSASSVTAIDNIAGQIFHPFGTIVLICSLPGLIAVVAMNMYSGALTSLTTIDTFSKLRPTITARAVAVMVIAVAGTAGARALSSNFLAHFSYFLALVLYFMIPWTAVNLVDYFFIRKENYAIRELFKPHGIYGAWSWKGVGSYALGFCVMIPFMNAPVSGSFWVGPVAKALNGGDISPFIGFPVAAICYYLLARDTDVAAEAKVAAEQQSLLEAEAAAHVDIGTHEDDLLGDVGARVSDEPIGGSEVERHPGA
jgi:NCS1 nucleoside transporter family